MQASTQPVAQYQGKGQVPGPLQVDGALSGTTTQ